LLKSSPFFKNTSETTLNIISGSLVLTLGLITIFPKIWEKITIKFGFSTSSQNLLYKSSQKEGWVGSILIGASLAPVFASCSPTYSLILATVLKVDYTKGVIALAAYSLGLGLFMLLISIFGQSLIRRVKGLANPDGVFRKVLGIIFVLVGILILSGQTTRLKVYLSKFELFDSSRIERKFSGTETEDVAFNVNEPYLAPELVGIDGWVNSQGETLENLKGKVVVIDFWTYSCINCIRTLPSLTGWYEKYKDDGLVVIGVHTPEFQFEKKKENVQRAAKQYNINYPIALDNEYSTWNAFKNRAWPAHYFIDKDGKVRHLKYGEGSYEQNEMVIRQLLKEAGANLDEGKTIVDDKVPVSNLQTAETYLGYTRGREKFLNERESIHDEPKNYAYVDDFQNGEWTLNGDFIVNEEEITSLSEGSKLKFKFSAKELYLVMSADTESRVRVKANGKYLSPTNFGGSDVDNDGYVLVKESDLFRLFKSEKFEKDVELELEFGKGVKAYAFTFGS
jgi:thiol-disulfide isomerase/thioredoxin